MSDSANLVDIIDQQKKSAPPTYAELQRENEKLRAVLDQVRWERDLLQDMYDHLAGEEDVR